MGHLDPMAAALLNVPIPPRTPVLLFHLLLVTFYNSFFLSLVEEEEEEKEENIQKVGEGKKRRKIKMKNISVEAVERTGVLRSPFLSRTELIS